MGIRGHVELNSAGYFVAVDKDGRPIIRRDLVQQVSDPISFTGQVVAESIRSINRAVLWPPVYGGGCKRISSRMGKIDPRDYFRFWDAEDVMTWWPNDTTLGLLMSTSTEYTGAEVIRGSCSYKGSLVSIWEDSQNQAGDANRAHVALYTGSTKTWGGGGNLDKDSGATGEIVALDIQAPGPNLIAVACGLVKTGTAPTVRDIVIQTSTAGASWTHRANYDLLTNAPTANEDIDGALVAPRRISGESIVAAWDEDAKTIVFKSSSDDVTWASETFTIPSGNGPQGIAVYPGIDDADKLLVFTREGVWEVDTSPATWTGTLVYPMVAHNDNGRRATVHDGSVWFGIGVDNNTPASVVRYTVQGGTRIFEVNKTSGVLGDEAGVYLGPAAGDGCVAALLGPIRWWKSAGSLLFATVGGGAASRNGWVMLHNGKGWHVAAKIATANRKAEWLDVTSEDDGTPRLHFASRVGSADSSTLYQSLPLSNPADGQTYAYEANGYLYSPETDFDLPEIDKSFRKLFVNAVSLGTTSTEYEAVTYGANGAAASTTSLDNIVDGTLTLTLASGAGVSLKSIALGRTLYRTAANTALTPKDRGAVIKFKPRFTPTYRFTFTVDVKKTADMRHSGDTRTVVTDLVTAAALVTQPTFQYIPIAQTNVDVIGLVFYDKHGAAVSADAVAEYGGTAEVVVEEPGG